MTYYDIFTPILKRTKNMNLRKDIVWQKKHITAVVTAVL